MSEQDVAFIVSYHGRSNPLLTIAENANKAGGRTIGLTRPDSPLGQACQTTIGVDVPEDTTTYVSMASSIAHQMVIDILAQSVAARIGDQVLVRHNHGKKALMEHYMLPEEPLPEPSDGS